MSLIDQTYFVGDLNIPNTGTEAIAERLQYFIDKYELALLADLFGHELYAPLAVELGADGDASGSGVSVLSTRFERLVHGFEYTGQDGRPRKWRGLLYEDGSNIPHSLITNYVYWHWLKDQNTQTVGLGEVSTQAANSVLTSPMIKMNRAWNEMSEQIGEMCYFLQSNRDDYPEWVDSNWLTRMRMFRPQNQFGI